MSTTDATEHRVEATRLLQQLAERLRADAGFEAAARALDSGEPAAFDRVWGSSAALVGAAVAVLAGFALSRVFSSANPSV